MDCCCFIKSNNKQIVVFVASVATADSINEEVKYAFISSPNQPGTAKQENRREVDSPGPTVESVPAVRP